MSFTNGVILLVMVPAVIALAVWLLVSARAAEGRGTRVVVRCLGGHVFTTMWPPASRRNPFQAGVVRWRYCPVGEHWTMVTPVRPEDLSPAEWQMARRFHDNSIR